MGGAGWEGDRVMPWVAQAGWWPQRTAGAAQEQPPSLLLQPPQGRSPALGACLGRRVQGAAPRPARWGGGSDGYGGWGTPDPRTGLNSGPCGCGPSRKGHWWAARGPRPARLSRLSELSSGALLARIPTPHARTPAPTGSECPALATENVPFSSSSLTKH